MLEPDKCEDPHVERMLEAFAFLAARVHLKIDDEFPEITEALLSILYPHYLRPIPSMSIGEFHVDPSRCRRRPGLKLARGAVLEFAAGGWRALQVPHLLRHHILAGRAWPPPNGRRRTGCSRRSRPPKPWPPFASSCDAPGDLTFEKLGMSSLRFYLNGESKLSHTLYELLCNNCSPHHHARSVAQIEGRARDPAAPTRCARWVSREDEGMLPYPAPLLRRLPAVAGIFLLPAEVFLPRSHAGWSGSATAGFGNRAEVIFLISPFERAERRQMLELGVTAKTFRLNCAPIVNLFAQTAEPILLDHTRVRIPGGAGREPAQGHRRFSRSTKW